MPGRRFSLAKATRRARRESKNGSEATKDPPTSCCKSAVSAASSSVSSLRSKRASGRPASSVLRHTGRKQFANCSGDNAKNTRRSRGAEREKPVGMEIGQRKASTTSHRRSASKGAAPRTERGQVDPCPTDGDHRPLSERVRGLAATLMPGLMQQRSLRHNLQVESFHLLCSDQPHCRPYFQSVARRMFVNGRQQHRPEKFRLLHGTPNRSSMRDGCLSSTARWSPGGSSKSIGTMRGFRKGRRARGLI
jgi:hypothetical protein